MTATQFSLIFISVFLLTLLLTGGYKKFVLKKKIKRNYLLLFWFPILYFVFLWDADYFEFIAESQRERYEIPKIEETMRLNYRSRFSEVWKNRDTLKIHHATKVIKLGQSIEKEIDYFTNELENKTLRISTTFPLFSSNPRKEYSLHPGIISEEKLFWPKNGVKQLNELQNDSVLNAWKLN